MARGINVKLPLALDDDDTFAMNKELKTSVQQNLKNLILTSPGERIMIPEFGVGLRGFLFENDSQGLRSEISAKIHEQVSRYLPFISIQNIMFESAIENDLVDRNLLHIRVEYRITPIDTLDFLDLEVAETTGT